MIDSRVGRTTGLLLAAVLAGCVRTGRGAAAPSLRIATQANNAVFPSDAPASGVSPQLRARFEGLAATQQPNRVRFAGIASHGFITQGGRHTVALDVPAGRCLSIVSLATAPVRDLDARLFSPAGETLAEDTEPDAHPTVQLCASETRRVFLVLDAYDGQGAFAVGVFEARDRESFDPLATQLGGRPATAVSTGAVASEGERRLGEFREGIARRGFSVNGESQRVYVHATGSTRLAVEALASRCYTLAAFAEGGVRDVDLRVRDMRGAEIARDVRRERDGLVQVCPVESGALSVEIDTREGGDGSVLFQAFSAEAAAVGGANALWLGERTGWLASAMPAREIEARLARSATAMGLRSEARSESEGTALSGRLTAGEVRDVSIALPAAAPAPTSACVSVAFLAGTGLGRARLDLQFSGGAPRASEALAGGDGVMVAAWCGPVGRGALRARLRAEVGSGEWRLVRFERAMPSGVDPALAAQDLALELAARDAGYAPTSAAEPLRVGVRGVRVTEAGLEAGECGVFALATALGGGRLTLRVEGGSGLELTEVRPRGPVVVSHCAERNAERLSFELTAEPEWAPESAASFRQFRRR